VSEPQYYEFAYFIQCLIRKRQQSLVVFPGMALMLAVFTFNLIGDGLRDLVDPQRRT